MHRMQRGCLVAGFLVWIAAGSRPSAAQYTANFQDAIISGVTSNWSGDYIVGSNTYADILFVQNGGMLSDGNGYLGYEASGSNNVAAVIGSVSVWSNAGSLYIGNSGANNFLWIADGGAVVATNSFVGYAGSNNEVLISSPGSVWTNSGDLTVGYSGSSNTLTITDGATVYDHTGHIGDLSGSGNNAVTVSGSGSVWSNSDGLSIGVQMFFQAGINSGNSLTITNGGAVYCGSGGAGALGESVVIVTGNGSVWNCGGGLSFTSPGFGLAAGYIQLTIADGAMVYSRGSTSGTVEAPVLVTDSGSVWSNSGALLIEGSDNVPFYGSLSVANGAAVYSASGELTGDGHVQAVVTGTGSVWRIENGVEFDSLYGSLSISDGGAVYCGSVAFNEDENAAIEVTGAGSILQIVGSLSWDSYGDVSVSDGGAIIADSVGGSNAANGYHPEITIAGGGLYVTNGPGTIVLDGYRGGTMTLNEGTVTANQLVAVTNRWDAFFNTTVSVGFASGLLTSGGTFVTNGNEFVVGDGIDVATFHLAGGFHSFADGLMVSSNAFVTGCGTIDGSVVVDPGGTIQADCGGSLTFTGIVINNGTLRASNGSVLEFYGPVVNNGLIDLSGGAAIFHSLFINNGSIIEPAPAFQITGIVQQSNNILITWMSSPGQTNELQVTPGGPGGTYSTNNFTPIFTVTNTVGSVTNYLDIGVATNSSRYYRVRLVP